jgi:uncharacterized phage protein (TIGR01671 family)
MNRPIKFRVWNKKSNEWCGTIGLNETISHNSIINLPDDLVFVQYTGLKDSKGNEVYEGDIVKYKTWTGSHDGTTEEHQTQVQFKDGAYYPRYIDDECEDSWYSFKVYDLEVVGNIFETPHLDENE